MDKNINISKAISDIINKIIEEYYYLVRLELDYFKYIVICEGIPIKEGRLHISTSGQPELIDKRRRILFESFYSQKDSLRDEYFLKLAKLFETSKRNKPLSIPVLIDKISKNLHLLSKKQSLEQVINQYSNRMNDLRVNVDLIIEHRNKCLAHNDSKVNGCKHLENISTNETRAIIDLIKYLINSLSEIFNTPNINEKLISEIQSESFLSNLNLIENLEK